MTEAGAEYGMHHCFVGRLQFAEILSSSDDFNEDTVFSVIFCLSVCSFVFNRTSGNLYVLWTKEELLKI